MDVVARFSNWKRRLDSVLCCWILLIRFRFKQRSSILYPKNINPSKGFMEILKLSLVVECISLLITKIGRKTIIKVESITPWIIPELELLLSSATTVDLHRLLHRCPQSPALLLAVIVHPYPTPNQTHFHSLCFM
ncbi:hypothetical protein HYC85_017829 [Camellia sinensis]|uniref:Uncharacterized protein n=1 Tax=Camellia sinensis TaxID=4442 RepID=A0A7J7GSJ1_CAMSI|nr:hypothetical protein HYC85_017829 [Camellia sinensis]